LDYLQLLETTKSVALNNQLFSPYLMNGMLTFAFTKLL